MNACSEVECIFSGEFQYYNQGNMLSFQKKESVGLFELGTHRLTRDKAKVRVH